MIDEKETQLVIQRYTELKTERSKYIPRWKEIQNYVAITNNVNSNFENEEKETQQKDVFINDPTAFTCVNQAGDYLSGILWNSNAITLEPSEYIKKQIQSDELSDFYKSATKIVLEQMNSTDSGFNSILRSYCYEQFSFATSGIGVFKSKNYENFQTECCLTFKPFGVWNCCIDEGANNKIDVIYTIYHWRLNQIIEEFCYTDDKFDENKFNELPDEIKRAYEANKYNDKFKLVHGILPNNAYCMGKRGKIGAKYKGYWFLENSKNNIFHIEYYKKLPIAICRAIRVNNQVYGESSGTLCISAIKMLNHITGQTVDNIEKQTDAPLGVLSGALVAGNVFNRSAGSVTTLNAKAVGNNQSPIFPIQQVGDISGVVNVLIPQLKQDITNIFKIDQLLDFNNQTQMTATESSYRMGIRGKSISGLISQQKTECIEPVVHRTISIIQECGLFGEILDDLPLMTPEDIAYLDKVMKEGNYIPDVVAKAMKDNKIWYKLKFNGELEKIANAEIYEAVGRFLQYMNAVLQIKPELAIAINAYEFLDFLKGISNLVNDKLIKPKTEYENLLKTMEEAQAKNQEIQSQINEAQYAKTMSETAKNGAMANAIQR